MLIWSSFCIHKSWLEAAAANTIAPNYTSQDAKTSSYVGVYDSIFHCTCAATFEHVIDGSLELMFRTEIRYLCLDSWKSLHEIVPLKNTESSISKRSHRKFIWILHDILAPTAHITLHVVIAILRHILPFVPTVSHQCLRHVHIGQSVVVFTQFFHLGTQHWTTS